MAKKPAGIPVEGEKREYETETEEFVDRLQDARAQKSHVQADLQEAYFFCNPRLARNVTSNTAPTKPLETGAEALATDLATELSVDFATELIAGFFPPHMNWVKSVAGEEIADEEWKDIEEAVKARDNAIFQAIRASNFNATLALSLNPDMAIGTVGLMIDDPHPARPISALHVPIRELEVNVGRDGLIDDRFAVRWVKARLVRSLLGPGIKLAESVEKDLKDNPGKVHSVTWGWWRDWSKPTETCWYHCIALDEKVVATDEKVGEGSCGLIVMRFMPHALIAWGNGPAMQSLPKLRVHDAMTLATQDRADIAVAPPIGFPDDGVVNFEGGIEAGKAYPMRPGGGKDIVKLYFEGDADFGFYTLADVERSVKRSFYADYPEQRGDTPPTATQWIDEMVMAQRRIGTPGVPLWAEGPAEVFKRFAYLLTERGKIAPVEINGRAVALVPENPATRAQEQQDVQLGVRLLEICKGLMPETSQAAIDELETIENLKKGLGDKMVVLRPKALVEELVRGLLTQAAQSGAVDAEA